MKKCLKNLSFGVDFDDCRSRHSRVILTHYADFSQFDFREFTFDLYCSFQRVINEGKCFQYEITNTIFFSSQDSPEVFDFSSHRVVSTMHIKNLIMSGSRFLLGLLVYFNNKKGIINPLNTR